MAANEKLAAYRHKRDFSRTPEPSGDQQPDGDQRRFVVQRHRARRLHYDFRLEIGGVLVSWAVPRGLTLDPKVRRAAFHVEDHPMEYFDFEGVIPKGEYGGGDVIVWDVGTWTLDKGSVDGGELHFDLYGEKLRGRFVLVRTKPGPKEEWLLLHKKDDYAVAGWNPEDYPRSVLSGRTNDDVKADPDRMWRSDLPVERAAVTLKAPPITDEELAELDQLKDNGTWEVFGRKLKVTNLDKVLFPGKTPVTKREFLRYSAQIAPTVVPYLQQRPMNLHRFPNGAQAKGFWHKQLPDHAPDWLPRWENPGADPGESHTYLVVDEPAALVWAANFGGVEWHAWTSRIDHPDDPTYALIDLDPGETTDWQDLLVLARVHRDALAHLKVSGCAKVTGRRGIQIWIPIAPGPSFDETRTWVRHLSEAVGAVLPELVSFKWQRESRRGLARLDYTQNAINKTLVAPYSPRAAAEAPVSAPISWDELDDPGLRPDGFTIRSLPERLAAKGDLFREALQFTQRLPPLT
jgi:bifunctional non-homologous end joining protein LigD